MNSESRELLSRFYSRYNKLSVGTYSLEAFLEFSLVLEAQRDTEGKRGPQFPSISKLFKIFLKEDFGKMDDSHHAFNTLTIVFSPYHAPGIGGVHSGFLPQVVHILIRVRQN